MKRKTHKVGKFIYWAPRILSILFILWLMLFSLDVFGNGYSFWETLVGLFMHNLPALILLAVTIIAWKRELVGAIVFALAGLLYISLLVGQAIRGSGQWYMLMWALTISGPAFLVSILFFINWRKKGKAKSKKRRR